MDKRILASEQTLRAQRPVVHVSVPAKVAYDLKAMNKVTAAVLDRLGCSECHSALDIRYDFVRDFFVNEKLEVLSDVTRGRG